tara:strand:- start:16710 stop:19646 length:2937 start_codon:yes stop_codon:yes gene_type:complete
MAEKIIAIKIDVQGTADQKKKIVGLELNLKKLTDQQKKLKKQVKDGVITNEQYAKSIAKVNLGLKGTRRQLLVTRQAMLGIDGFTTRLGKSFKKFGTQVSGAFVGLFAAQKLFQVLKDGFDTIKNFEQQMAKVKAITGATSEDFEKLTNNAKELGKSTIFTAEEVGKLQEEYAKLGFSTGEILNATEATLNLATATSSDLAQAATIAGATIRGFGLDASEAGRVTDVMAKAFSGSALDLDKFGLAMAKVAPVASVAGVSLEKTTALLGKLTDAGFDASTSGTALRNIFIKLEKNGLTLEQSFEQIRNATNPVTEAVELFDVRSASLALTLANNETAANEFASSLENAEGSAKDMADTVSDTLQGDIKALGSAWDGLILSIENSEGVFRDITQSITGLLSDISTGVEDMDISEQIGLDFVTLSASYEKRAEAAVQKFRDLRKEVNEAGGDAVALRKLQARISKDSVEDMDASIADTKAVIAVQKILTEELKQTEKADIERAKKSKEVLKQLEIESQLRDVMAKDFKSQSDEVLEATIEQNRLQLTKIKRQKQEKVLSVELFNKEKESIQGINKLIRVELSEREKNLTAQKKQEKADAKRLGDLKRADEKAKKAAEKLANDKLTAEEKLIKDSEKLRNEADLLAITKKEDLEIAKLRIAIQAQQDEIENSIANEDLKNTALLDLEANRIAKEKAIRGKFKDEKAADDLKDDEKDKEKKKKELDDNAAFALEVKQQGIQIAGETAILLTDIAQQKADREKDIELSNLDAQLEGGLITQQQFEAKKLEIEKKAFQKKKKLELANVAISLATEIASIQASAAANPLNAVTFGGAGISQAAVLTGIAIAKSAIQAGAIASQKFADGGFTGGGSGIADETGFKQAGIVHEGEYVVPKHVLGTSEGSSLVGALENMRTNQPMPNLGIGYANGGMVSGGNLDLQGLENRMTKAISNSLSSIQVTNVATETTSQAIKVNNIEQEASFG